MTRFARVKTPASPAPVQWVDGAWHEILSFEDPEPTGRVFDAEAPLAAPVEPTIVFGMMHNAAEGDRDLPPQAFMKSARSVVGPGENIVVDSRRGRVIGEGELALVVGKTARNLTLEDVPDVLLGWTIGNDVTATDQAPLDSTMVQAKCGDGFTPIGPWIETDIADFNNLGIRVFESGVLVATGTTADLAWNPFEALVHLSGHLTLGPGDIILTGCPGTGVDLTVGAVVDIEVDGLGRLSSGVVAL